MDDFDCSPGFPKKRKQKILKKKLIKAAMSNSSNKQSAKQSVKKEYQHQLQNAKYTWTNSTHTSPNSSLRKGSNGKTNADFHGMISPTTASFDSDHSPTQTVGMYSFTCTGSKSRPHIGIDSEMSSAGKYMGSAVADMKGLKLNNADSAHEWSAESGYLYDSESGSDGGGCCSSDDDAPFKIYNEQHTNQGLDDSLNLSPGYYIPNSPLGSPIPRRITGSGSELQGTRAIPPPSSHEDVFAYVDNFPALSPSGTLSDSVPYDYPDAVEEGYHIDEVALDDFDEAQFDSSGSGSDSDVYSERSFHIIHLEEDSQVLQHPRGRSLSDTKLEVDGNAHASPSSTGTSIANKRDELLSHRLYGNSSTSSSVKSPSPNILLSTPSKYINSQPRSRSKLASKSKSSGHLYALEHGMNNSAVKSTGSGSLIGSMLRSLTPVQSLKTPGRATPTGPSIKRASSMRGMSLYGQNSPRGGGKASLTSTPKRTPTRSSLRISRSSSKNHIPLGDLKSSPQSHPLTRSHRSEGVLSSGLESSSSASSPFLASLPIGALFSPLPHQNTTHKRRSYASIVAAAGNSPRGSSPALTSSTVTPTHVPPSTPASDEYHLYRPVVGLTSPRSPTPTLLQSISVDPMVNEVLENITTQVASLTVVEEKRVERGIAGGICLEGEKRIQDEGMGVDIESVDGLHDAQVSAIAVELEQVSDSNVKADLVEIGSDVNTVSTLRSDLLESVEPIVEPVLLVHEPTDEENEWYRCLQERDSLDESIRNRVLKALSCGYGTISGTKAKTDYLYFTPTPTCDRIYDRVNAVFNCTQKATPFSVPSTTTPLYDIIKIFVENLKARSGPRRKYDDNIFVHLMEVYLADKELSNSSNHTDVDALIEKEISKLQASKSNSSKNKGNKGKFKGAGSAVSGAICGNNGNNANAKNTKLLHLLQDAYGVDFDSNSNSYYEAYLKQQQSQAANSNLKELYAAHMDAVGEGLTGDARGSVYRTTRSNSITSNSSYASVSTGGSYSLDGSEEESSDGEDEEWGREDDLNAGSDVESVCSDCELVANVQDGGSKNALKKVPKSNQVIKATNRVESPYNRKHTHIFKYIFKIMYDFQNSIKKKLLRRSGAGNGVNSNYGGGIIAPIQKIDKVWLQEVLVDYYSNIENYQSGDIMELNTLLQTREELYEKKNKLMETIVKGALDWEPIRLKSIGNAANTLGNLGTLPSIPGVQVSSSLSQKARKKNMAMNNSKKSPSSGLGGTLKATAAPFVMSFDAYSAMLGPGSAVGNTAAAAGKSDFIKTPIEAAAARGDVSHQSAPSPIASSGTSPTPVNSTAEQEAAYHKKKDELTLQLNDLEEHIEKVEMSVAQTYISNPHFIHHLVSQLPHQDDRFASPLVSLICSLMLVYPISLNENHVLLQHMTSVTKDRYKRCQEISQFALQHEIQINEVANQNQVLSLYQMLPKHKHLIADMVLFGCSADMPPITESDTMSSTPLKVNADERVAIRKILDSDISVIELLSCAIEWENVFSYYSNCILHMYIQSARKHCGDVWSGLVAPINSIETKAFTQECDVSIKGDLCMDSVQASSKYDRNRMWQHHVIYVFMNIVQCYASRLSHKGESIESPFVMRHILTVGHCLMTLVNKKFYGKQGGYDGGNLVDSFYKELCGVLHSTWPKSSSPTLNCDIPLSGTPKARPEQNYMCENAYIQVFGVVMSLIPTNRIYSILKCYADSKEQSLLLTSNAYKIRNSHVSGIKGADGEKSSNSSALVLPKPYRAVEIETTNASACASCTVPIVKCLSKLITCFQSKHFKVASNAISLLLKQDHLYNRWIVAPPTTAGGTDSYGEMSSGGSVDEEDRISMSVIDDIVSILRQNRDNHWHTYVKSLTNNCLDELIELLYEM